MHAALLVPPWRSAAVPAAGQTRSAPAALSTRLITLAPPVPMPVATAQPASPSPSEAPAVAARSELPPGSGELRLAVAGLHVAHPDASVAGGRLRLRLLLRLDAQAGLESLESDAGTEVAETFVDMVREAVQAATWLALSPGHRTEFCLDLQFDEQKPAAALKLRPAQDCLRRR